MLSLAAVSLVCDNGSVSIYLGLGGSLFTSDIKTNYTELTVRGLGRFRA
jgi:hypothetical protein